VVRAPSHDRIRICVSSRAGSQLACEGDFRYGLLSPTPPHAADCQHDYF